MGRERETGKSLTGKSTGGKVYGHAGAIERRWYCTSRADRLTAGVRWQAFKLPQLVLVAHLFIGSASVWLDHLFYLGYNWMVAAIGSTLHFHRCLSRRCEITGQRNMRDAQQKKNRLRNHWGIFFWGNNCWSRVGNGRHNWRRLFRSDTFVNSDNYF